MKCNYEKCCFFFFFNCGSARNCSYTACNVLTFPLVLAPGLGNHLIASCQTAQQPRDEHGSVPTCTLSQKAEARIEPTDARQEEGCVCVCVSYTLTGIGEERGDPPKPLASFRCFYLLSSSLGGPRTGVSLSVLTIKGLKLGLSKSWIECMINV